MTNDSTPKQAKNETDTAYAERLIRWTRANELRSAIAEGALRGLTPLEVLKAIDGC